LSVLSRGHGPSYLDKLVHAMDTYFTLEREIMGKNIGPFPNRVYGSIIEEQEIIMGNVMGD
jgi:hypothetical protein